MQKNIFLTLEHSSYDFCPLFHRTAKIQNFYQVIINSVYITLYKGVDSYKIFDIIYPRHGKQPTEKENAKIWLMYRYVGVIPGINARREG